jgi:transposase InsO family protein
MRWVTRYRQFGEEGLKDLKTGPAQPRLPAPVRDKIIGIKTEQPTFGIKRISQLLRRMFFLKASPETVRQKLRQAQLMAPTPPPRKRNLTRPRFFERATPNQMWQSDIFTFRLGGRYAYVIAFLDDYSRYVVGADLFRSPTAQATIEVYRVAMGEYQPPKEMLTDNGRQYTTWRGTSRFEAELKKDRVIHIKSRPQHPMTLGKIERFWATIWQEFLTRAQFDSFEQARERIKLWIKYYNHKRPHQGIEGLCPADRFFEIQSQLRQTIDAGIQENILEMALRGQPKAPFYMVGRMEGQSVVLRAEKGKLKLELSDPQNNQSSGAAPIKELVYELNKNFSDATEPKNENRKEETHPHLPQLHRGGQSPGGAGCVDRTLQTGGSLPADEHQMAHLPVLAEPGDGGNAPGAGSQSEPGPGTGAEPAPAEPSPEAATHQQPDEVVGPPGTVAKQSCQQSGGCAKNSVDEPATEGPRASDHHLESSLRPDHRDPGSPATGHLPPTLLPMGEASAPGLVESPGSPTQRPPQKTAIGSGHPSLAAPDATTGKTGAAL